MKSITLPNLREMFEAGVHFGHKKQNSDARGSANFFGVKNKVVVINLEKTRAALELALSFLAKEAQKGSLMLFVGTKPQAKDKVEEVAKKLNMPFVTNRWLGGTLTNFDTIKKSVKHLDEMEAELNDAGKNETRTKKEGLMLARRIENIKYNLSGMSEVKQRPDLLVVIGAQEEENAINEALTQGIPTVAILDTDANPKKVTYPIPANDKSPKSINMILDLIGDVISAHYKPKSVAPLEDKNAETDKNKVNTSAK